MTERRAECCAGDHLVDLNVAAAGAVETHELSHVVRPRTVDRCWILGVHLSPDHGLLTLLLSAQEIQSLRGFAFPAGDERCRPGSSLVTVKMTVAWYWMLRGRQQLETDQLHQVQHPSTSADCVLPTFEHAARQSTTDWKCASQTVMAEVAAVSLSDCSRDRNKTVLTVHN